jgi:hypothetical protein
MSYNVFLGTAGAEQSGIYALAPGAAQWRLVAPVPPSLVHLAALGQDAAASNPAELWRLVQIEGPQDEYALWTHAA